MRAGSWENSRAFDNLAAITNFDRTARPLTAEIMPEWFNSLSC